MGEDGYKLSLNAKSLWGKLSLDGTHCWLPLWMHLADTAEIADLIWLHWVPAHTKKIIAEGFDLSQDLSLQGRMAYARKIVRFLAASHDCGKAEPAFVEKAVKAGFGDIVDDITGKGLPIKIKNHAIAREFPHAMISEYILEQMGTERSLADIVGGHHGSPVDNARALQSVPDYPSVTGVSNADWQRVQDEIVQYALYLADFDSIPQVNVTVPAQVILTGLLIMADWLASDEREFPLLARDYGMDIVESSRTRAKKAWQHLHLPEYTQFSSDCSWDALYPIRFGRQPRPVQVNALSVALQMKQPGLMVIEAPMGEGKTEAALAAAEAFAKRFGLGGIYFALPTQATSDGIFPRVSKWIEQLRAGSKKSIFLAHGKAGFNKEYTGIKLKSHIYDEADAHASVIVNDWTQGRKKGLLADFVVGTIDHVLMGGLKAKHLSLRHLGLVNKVIILDECHAYDAYMNQYLDLVLNWLGAYHVPVIVLSATLPPHRRRELLQAYQDSSILPQKQKKQQLLSLRAALSKQTPVKKSEPTKSNEVSPYPLISYTDGTRICQNIPKSAGKKHIVHLKQMDEDCLAEELEKLLADGGCAGIICNTVSRAQEIAELMEMCFGADTVRLLHSRFLSFDRVRKEQEVRHLLGPGEDQRPERLIVVGTQVMEQSLDVDFDILFTEICPMDLLLQRIGRLHRHNRKMPRPSRLQEAYCYIMGIKENLSFDEGCEAVYGKYLLLKTRAFLPDILTLPDDIPRLVQQVYEKGYDNESFENLHRMEPGIDGVDIQELYKKSKWDYDKKIAEKKQKAEMYQIKTPKNQRQDLIGWLSVPCKEDRTGKKGEATVRDSESSLDVLVLCKKDDGHLYTVPWLPEYGDIQIDGSIPDDETAKAIAGCSVSLPSSFAQNWKIDHAIDELEQIVIDYHLNDLYASHWLNGELFLIIDESYETTLLGQTISYDERYGLRVEKEE
ncbi:CRISPR-associated helicase Cas3' [Mitsuokella sp. WILCCON 0060]|uniref:CRISPR-associated helicase Cas3' n=1 Tax=Mitsuokella sp. WILCCON 0060 TaxID=3345341 RepID=UPI003F1CF7ED